MQIAKDILDIQTRFSNPFTHFTMIGSTDSVQLIESLKFNFFRKVIINNFGF